MAEQYYDPPLSTGELLEASFRVAYKNWWPILKLYLVGMLATAIMVTITVLLGGGLGPFRLTPEGHGSELPDGWGWLFILLILSSALVWAVISSRQNRYFLTGKLKISLIPDRIDWQFIKTGILLLLLLMTISITIIVILFLLFGIILGFNYFSQWAGEPIWFTIREQGILAIFIFVAYICFFLVTILYLIVKINFASLIAVTGHKRPIRVSWGLTRGRWKRIASFVAALWLIVVGSLYAAELLIGWLHPRLLTGFTPGNIFVTVSFLAIWLLLQFAATLVTSTGIALLFRQLVGADRIVLPIPLAPLPGLLKPTWINDAPPGQG